MIDKEHVLHIAALARLNLSDCEVDNLIKSMGSVLDYVEQLDQVDTGDVEPTCFMAPVHDPLRDDSESPSLEHEQILQNGPNVKKGYFAVPKIIGG